MGFQRGRDLRLHHSQVIQFIDHRDVDAGRTGRAVAAVGALPVISMGGRLGQYGGIVFFFFGGGLVCNRLVHMPYGIISNHHAGNPGPGQGVMQALYRGQRHAEG